MKLFLSIISLLSNLFVCFSQNSSENFVNYNIQNGLSQSSVMTIFQDRNHFLWFGTQDGLNKFDGTHFTVFRPENDGNYSLSDSWVNNILFEDSEGFIWMLTADRILNRFDPKTGSFFNFQNLTDDRKQALDFNKFFFIVEDSQKNIWFSTVSGLYRLDKSKTKATNFSFSLFEKPDKNKTFVRQAITDKSGNLWFASSSGLFKFDLKNGKVVKFLAMPGNNLKIANNYINRIIIDNSGILWAITPSGLSRHDAKTGYFQNFKFPLDTLNNKNFGVRSTEIDAKGNIWIGTNIGAFQFNTKTNKLNWYYNKVSDKQSLSHNHIYSIQCTKKGNIFLAGVGGIDEFDEQNNKFIHYGYSNNWPAGAAMIDLLEDKTGQIWAFDWVDYNTGSNVFKLDQNQKELVHLAADPNNPFIIKAERVLVPYLDRSGNLWFGSWGEGISKYTPNLKKFEVYRRNSFSDKLYAGTGVFGFAEDKSGDIWIAAYSRGIVRFNPKTKDFKLLGSSKLKPELNAENRTIAMAADKNGNIWCATSGGGIIMADPKTGRISKFDNSKQSKVQLLENFIKTIHIDSQNRLWIGYNSLGISCYNLNNGTIIHYQNDKNNANSLSNNFIWSIGSDHLGNIWIASLGWIDKFNPENGQFTHYISKGKKGVNADKVLCIVEDSRGRIWLGTSGGGLSMFNSKTQSFSHWDTKDGLPNSVVYGVVEDNNGKLWLSTNLGLSQFDPANNTFINYDVSNGLQSNEFNINAFLKSSTGKLYFGGISGFNAFYPNEIQKDTVLPIPTLTGLQLFGKRVEVLPVDKYKLLDNQASNGIIYDGKNQYIVENIAYQKELVLNYDEKVFTIEFAGINYSNPEKTNFKYRLKGFEKDWNNVGSRTYVTYVNLPAGEFIFELSASNSEGTWNPKPAILKITVLPPFWKTWWFILLEIVLLISILAIYIRKREKNLVKHKNVLERKVEERTHQLNEMNEELKLRTELIMKQKEEIYAQAQQLKNELVAQNHASELALLRSQINPHFLFNTLNNIYSLVYQKADTAPEAVMKLSEIMRYMLYDSGVEKVALSKEINYLESFIELHRLRIRDKSFIEFNVTGNVNSLLIPPMLLVPFVENAFKHGTKQAKTPGIKIDLAIDGSDITFEVKNYYKKDNSNKDKIGGIGLPNVKRRLELLFNGRHNLFISDANDEFYVKLELNCK
jgi:ligand-binding sensor domain-containing protein